MPKRSTKPPGRCSHDSPADKAAKAREKAFEASGGLAQKVEERERLFEKNSFRGGAYKQQESPNR